MRKCHKDPACVIFLKRGLLKGIENDIPMCQTHIYRNTKTTNTLIQHMTKCQKDSTCGIFLKRGLFKDIKNYIPMCQMCKYKIKCQKDSTCVIFLNTRLLKDVFCICFASLFSIEILNNQYRDLCNGKVSKANPPWDWKFKCWQLFVIWTNLNQLKTLGYLSGLCNS